MTMRRRPEPRFGSDPALTSSRANSGPQIEREMKFSWHVPRQRRWRIAVSYLICGRERGCAVLFDGSERRVLAIREFNSQIQLLRTKDELNTRMSGTVFT